jgi:hypothetical protein
MGCVGQPTRGFNGAGNGSGVAPLSAAPQGIWKDSHCDASLSMAVLSGAGVNDGFGACFRASACGRGGGRRIFGRSGVCYRGSQMQLAGPAWRGRGVERLRGCRVPSVHALRHWTMRRWFVDSMRSSNIFCVLCMACGVSIR